MVVDQEALEPGGVDVAMDSGRGDLAVYVKYQEIAEGSTSHLERRWLKQPQATLDNVCRREVCV